MKIATIILNEPTEPNRQRYLNTLAAKYGVSIGQLQTGLVSVIGRLSDVRRFVRELAVNDCGPDWLDEPLECICERYGDEIGIPIHELVYNTRNKEAQQ